MNDTCTNCNGPVSPEEREVFGGRCAWCGEAASYSAKSHRIYARASGAMAARLHGIDSLPDGADDGEETVVDEIARRLTREGA